MTKLTLIQKHTYKTLNCLFPVGTLKLTFSDTQGKHLQYLVEPGDHFYPALKKLKVNESVKALYGTEQCWGATYINNLHLQVVGNGQLLIV